MANISQIKLPDNTTYDIKDNRITDQNITNWNNAVNRQITVTMDENVPSSPSEGDIWFVLQSEETLLEPL